MFLQIFILKLLRNFSERNKIEYKKFKLILNIKY